MSAPLTTLNDEEEMFRSAVRDFAEDRVRPLVEQMEQEASQPRELLDEMVALGLMGIEIPEQYGGAGASFFMSILAIEELSRVDPAIAIPVDIQNTLIVNQFLRWGSDEQKQRFLPRLARDTIGSYALSEAGSGSDAFALKTSASRFDGGFRLSGRKLWISNAAEAGLFVVFANADRAAGHRGITAFVVERDLPGFKVGRKEDKLGVRASSTCELVFDDCSVPKSQVPGEVGRGVNILMSGLDYERVVLAAGPLGLMQACFDVVMPYVHERQQFGEPIGTFQLMQGKIADMYSTMNACRAYVYAVARACDAGRTTRFDAAGCILYASEKATWMASEAIQALGGNGYINEFATGRLLRNAKLYEIGAGTSEIRRMLIGRELFNATS